MSVPLAHQLVDHAIGYDLVGNLDTQEAARLRVTRRLSLARLTLAKEPICV